MDENIGALHAPVLADRCEQLLAPAIGADGAVAIDATLGMGGHSELLLRRHPGLRVIGVDRDPQAIDLAGRRLAPFGDRFQAVHAVYDQIGQIAADFGQPAGEVDGVLFDLGVSSLQLDRAERGFSYSKDAPLDMRMDQSTGRTAAQLLQEEPESELRQILYAYGQERFAPRIAAEVVRRRQVRPLRGTGELADLVRDAIPHAARRRGGNPAKRTFQALRIAVNAELHALATALPAALQALRLGGRIVVMSYHSLEDGLVKEAFRNGLTSATPLDLPQELAGHEPYLRDLTRGAEKADDGEQAANPRSASVRLRAVEKVRPVRRAHTGSVTS